MAWYSWRRRDLDLTLVTPGARNLAECRVDERTVACRITAVVRPAVYRSVVESIRAVGVTGVTVTSVRTDDAKPVRYGRSLSLPRRLVAILRQLTAQAVGKDHPVEDLRPVFFPPMVKLEIAVLEDVKDQVIAAIIDAARTPMGDDGEIWIEPLVAAVRIRTGQLDQTAVSDREALDEPQIQGSNLQRRRRAFNHLHMGMEECAAGDGDAAEQDVVLALRTFEELGDRFGMGEACYELALLHVQRGNASLAIDLFKKALRIFADLEDESRLAKACRQLALVHGANGDGQAAIERYREAIEMFRRVGDRAQRAMCHVELGAALAAAERPEAAVSELRRAFEVFESIPDPPNVARSAARIAELLTDARRYEEALPYVIVALREETSSDIGESERRTRLKCLRTIRSELGAQTFDDSIRRMLDASDVAIIARLLALRE